MKIKKKTVEKITRGSLLLLLFMFGVVLGVKIEERRDVVVAQEVAAAELEALEYCKQEPAPELKPSQIAKRVKATATDSGKSRVSIGKYETTAYCACVKCCGKTDGITASGKKATAGRTIAADTSLLPFGTEVYINGHKYTVEDRGGAIKGKKIDIYFDSHAEALEYGRKTVEVFIDKQG